MRVLVAPDKFAGTLTAGEAAQAIAEGWVRAQPAASPDLAPMADGGPGFLELLHGALGGELHSIATTGPHGDPARARLLLVAGDTGPTAYLEAADVCGLHLAPARRRPVTATTAGLAPVLRAALEAGARRVVVGVGGTASTDGGRGVVEQLGAAWPADVALVGACDVEHPLLGEQGAAAVFAPQKGASADEVAELAADLTDWATQTGGDPTRPGAGAGGGLGYGLVLLGGELVSGAGLVVDALALRRRARAADLVVTGEGRLDGSSLRGKVVATVADVARETARPCLVLAGEVLVGRREAAAAGVDETWSVADRLGSVAAAKSAGRDGLADLAEQVARSWSRSASARRE